MHPDPLCVELRPAPGEPAVGAWQRTPVSQLTAHLTSVAERPGRTERTRIIAVDGRSGGGKSTLAARLVDHLPGAVHIGTDDFAWNAPMFAWSSLVLEGLVAPLAAGREVHYRPPAWDAHERAGAIDVPAATTFVVLEGVGAACRELADVVDAVVWVQSDVAEAERRGIARDIAHGENGDEAASIAFWHDWMAAELAYQDAQRPWTRADVIVAGTRPEGDVDGDVLWVPGPLR
ncbi:uridine kinase family protein [Microbacterium aurum]|uniref:uridine kinase family protein n=1 Tax=Microbacterium aurum TaxID=36805 RepID=UPI001EF50098|nr:hypothetical protein [Microbacterium aurum]MCG7415132.1 hypothetical protein [Microbacterium aurum]